jgi:TldD protein
MDPANVEHPAVNNPLIDPSLISRLLGRALSRGAGFAEVYVQKRRNLGLELDAGEIRSSTAAASTGVGIRVIHEGAVAYAHADDLSEGALLGCADAVAQIAGATEAGVVAKPLAWQGRPDHSDPTSPPSNASIEDRVALLMSAHETAHGAHSAIERVLGFYADVDEDVLIANSEGLFVQDRRALCRLSLQVIAKDKNGQSRVGSHGGGSRRGVDHYEKELTPKAIAEEAVRMAVAQLGAKPAPAGENTVVLGPSSSGVLLHEAVGHGLEADFIRKRTSLFTGRVGEKVASDLCTVVDDGTLPGLRGSLNIDDEGTPTQRNVLIENGVLKGYMNDRLNADLMETERSGNGRRQSFRHSPLPRMTNTFMAAGEHDPDEILKEVKKGIYCRAFGGGQVDIANGNFVFEVREGYLIEDGKITAPVQGATLVGNGAEALTRVTRVGSDAKLDPGVYTCGKDGQSVPVNVGLPTLRMEAMTVGGTGGSQ